MPSPHPPTRLEGASSRRLAGIAHRRTLFLAPTLGQPVLRNARIIVATVLVLIGVAVVADPRAARGRGDPRRGASPSSRSRGRRCAPVRAWRQASRAVTAFVAGTATPWLWLIGVVVAVAVPIVAQLIVRPTGAAAGVAHSRPGRCRHHRGASSHPPLSALPPGRPPIRRRPSCLCSGSRSCRVLAAVVLRAATPRAGRRSRCRGTRCSFSRCCRTRSPPSTAARRRRPFRRRRLGPANAGRARSRHRARDRPPRAVRAHRARTHARRRGSRRSAPRRSSRRGGIDRHVHRRCRRSASSRTTRVRWRPSAPR